MWVKLSNITIHGYMCEQVAVKPASCWCCWIVSAKTVNERRGVTDHKGASANLWQGWFNQLPDPNCHLQTLRLSSQSSDSECQKQSFKLSVTLLYRFFQIKAKLFPWSWRHPSFNYVSFCPHMFRRQHSQIVVKIPCYNSTKSKVFAF